MAVERGYSDRLAACTRAVQARRVVIDARRSRESLERLTPSRTEAKSPTVTFSIPLVDRPYGVPDGRSTAVWRRSCREWSAGCC
jgi:hypothetical protein